MLSDDEILRQAAERIIKAGKNDKGVRLSAKETQLLLYYNLPCTADDPRAEEEEIETE